jgi:Family of unknown function (DUF6491)
VPAPTRGHGVLLALGALAAAGCATSRTQPERVAAPWPGTDACVFISNVSDWDVIDATTMIVYAPLRKDAYLLKLFAPLPELNFKQRVGFEDSDHNGQLCGNGDYLLIRDEVSSRRMPIVAFRKLTPEQAKQLLQAGKSPAAKPDSEQPPTGKN